MLEEFFFIKSLLFWVQVCTGKLIDQKIQVNRNHLSSAYTPLKSHISGSHILCILRFAKNCTRENKDTTFDHEIAKFDTRENFHLYGILESSCPSIPLYVYSINYVTYF